MPSRSDPVDVRDQNKRAFLVPTMQVSTNSDVKPSLQYWIVWNLINPHRPEFQFYQISCALPVLQDKIMIQFHIWWWYGHIFAFAIPIHYKIVAFILRPVLKIVVVLNPVFCQNRCQNFGQLGQWQANLPASNKAQSEIQKHVPVLYHPKIHFSGKIVAYHTKNMIYWHVK